MTARHPATGQFASEPAAVAGARQVMAEAESRETGRRDEAAADPGAGLAWTPTVAADAADRWGQAGGGL